LKDSIDSLNMYKNVRKIRLGIILLWCNLFEDEFLGNFKFYRVYEFNVSLSLSVSYTFMLHKQYIICYRYVYVFIGIKSTMKILRSGSKTIAKVIIIF